MQIFDRRKPPAWGLLIAGGVATGCAVFALATCDAYIPGRHGAPSRHVLMHHDPTQYIALVFFLLAAGGLLAFLTFFRAVQIEETALSLRAQLSYHLDNDKTSAPNWAYFALVAFIAFVVFWFWTAMHD
jgi:hypothetical protein